MQIENLRIISALTGSEETSGIIKGVKDSRRRLDALLLKIKDSERKLAEQASAAELTEAYTAGYESAEQPAAPQESAAVPAEQAGQAAHAPVAAETAPGPESTAEQAPAQTDVKAQEPEKEPVKAQKKAPAEQQPVKPEEKAVEQAHEPVAAAQPRQPAEKPVLQAQSEQKPEQKPAAKAQEPAERQAPAAVAAEAQKQPAAQPADGADKKAAAKQPEKKAEKKPSQPVFVPKGKMSLEELAALNQPRQRPVRTPGGGSGGDSVIKRSFINNAPDRAGGPRAPRDGARPPMSRPGGGRPLGRPGEAASAIPVHTGPSKTFGNKKKTPEKSSTFEDKKNLNKRTLIKKGLIQTAVFGDDDRMGRRYKAKKSKQQKAEERIKIEHAVVNSEIIPVKVLSEKLGISAAEITKRLFKEGIVKTINETLEYEEAAVLALDLGIELELKLDKTAEETLSEFHLAEDETDENLVARPPVITVMGHVDHGKTSLLDAIRKTEVASGEAGGITQHIGAYTVSMDGRAITFIDTPGHEAFTSMRARGASVTDVAILVVAADDGIMPQSVEAINHIKAAGVPMIVAINKMDKQTANPDRVMQQLSEHNVLPEQWGGDTIMVPVSAHTGSGIDTLLETILLVADVRGLKANPDRKARGTIIEAKLDKGKGPMATVLVQNGTLRTGDTIISGTTAGRIRAMLDDKGNNVKQAGPSYAVSVLGFSEVPSAGDPMFAVEDEKLSKQVLEERISKIKQSMVKSTQKVTLDDVFSRISEGQMKGLNIIVKADVQGSVEAVSAALEKLSNEEVKVNVIHGAAGAISESDVMLAGTASAIIIGFNVRPDVNAKAVAERDGVDLRLYRVIYEAIDDVTAALKGMLAPKYKETSLGEAQVRNVFKITGVGAVAGCYVTSGKILRNAKVRLLRDNVVIFEGAISSLKRFKDDVREVASGYECGISIENYNDIKEGDVIEAFIIEEIKQ